MQIKLTTTNQIRQWENIRKAIGAKSSTEAVRQIGSMFDRCNNFRDDVIVAASRMQSEGAEPKPRGKK